MLKIITSLLTTITVVLSISKTCSEPLGQSENNTSNTQMVTPQTIVSDLQSDSTAQQTNNSPDTIAYKLFNHYNQWSRASRICEYLLTEAAVRGFEVTEQELHYRLSLYSLVFPGVSFNSERIHKEITIEKYLINKIGICPSSGELARKYDDFTKSTPLQQPPSFTTIKPLLFNNILMSMDTVQHLCQLQAELASQKDRKTISDKSKTWNYNEIALSTDPTLCLVINHENNQCLSTVGEFNDFLRLNPVRKNLSLENARIQALRTLSVQLFFADKAEKEGLSDQENVIASWEHFEYNKRLANVYPFSSNMYNDSQFASTYNKYYDLFFKKKTIKTIALLGSTDSFYIDSICITIKKLEKERKNKRHGQISKFIDSLPWAILTSEYIPDTILSSLASLKKGQWKGNIKTPFGYFIGKVLNVTQQEEISIEQAHQKLQYLICADNARSNGKPDSLLVKEYYLNNKQEFVTPDTVFCRVWLVPLRDRSLFHQLDKNLRDQIISSDTISYKSEFFGSHLLPQETSDTLLQIIKGNNNKNMFIGPLFSHLGIWYFSVSTYSPGGASIPFNLVKNKIYNDVLRIKSFPFDSILNTETGKVVLKRAALAEAYRNFLVNQMKKEISEIPDKEIETLISNHTINVSCDDHTPKGQALLNMARNHILDNKVEQNLKIVESWVESLIIDRKLLQNDMLKQ